MSTLQASHSQYVGGWNGRWAVQHKHSGQWPSYEDGNLQLVTLCACLPAGLVTWLSGNVGRLVSNTKGALSIVQTFSEDIRGEEFVLLQMIRAVSAAGSILWKGSSIQNSFLKLIAGCGEIA